MRRAAPALVLACALLLALGACSSGSSDDEEGGLDFEGTVTLPQATGDRCEDPTSDITADVRSEGVGSEPAGIDITHAEAMLDDEDRLDVTFTTAGPVTTTEGTTFIVAQGMAGSPLAFELRATAGENGTWDVRAITWDSAERSTSIPITPTVEGNTLSMRVPMENLPPLGLYLSFGASSELAGVGRVLDDCSSLTTAPTVP